MAATKLTDKLTNIADAIREKTGGTDALTLDGMVEAIAGIQAGGGEDLLVAKISGTLTEYSNSEVTTISNNGFRYFNTLETVSLPNVEVIGSYAFNYCTTLTSASFPKATTISSYAFNYCTALTSASFPNLEAVSQGAFQVCPKLESLYFPNAKKIGKNAFYCNSGYMPLREINFPSATEIGDSSFSRAIYVTKAYIPKAEVIKSSAFSDCYNLTAVIIEQTNSVCTLSSANVFSGCYHILGTVNATYNPDGLKDGYIYVPDALVEDYKAATNWSTYASQIKPLSEYVEVSE